MTEPPVCAVMLTADRPEMARRAVECFRRQTYPHCRMLIWDTGKPPEIYPEHGNGVLYYNAHNLRKKTIGELRNDANSFVMLAAQPANIDILIHWDDDDWSHPNRIAEQVALLQSSGADAVGYNEMLFWRERVESKVGEIDPGTAWLYTGSILGTSLCYWRQTWDRVRFRSQRANPMHDKGVGEDHDFLLDLHAAGGMKTAEVSAIPQSWEKCSKLAFPEGPRMIARIHGSNTSNAYNPADMARETQHWKRVPEWDQFCRRTLEA